MSKFVVGPHVLVLINGTLFAECTSLDWESETPEEEVRGVDSMEAYELAPTTARMRGTVGCWRRHGLGGLEGRGVTAPFRHLPRERYFSLLVIDRLNGQRLLVADHCRVSRQQWHVQAKQAMAGSFGFSGITAANEAKYP